jgi:hypothetical protein
VWRLDVQRKQTVQSKLFSEAKQLLKREADIPAKQSLEVFTRSFLDQLVREGPFPDFERENFTRPEKVYPKSQKMVKNPSLWKRDEYGEYYKDGKLITYLSPPTRITSYTAGKNTFPRSNWSLFITFEDNAEPSAKVSFTAFFETPLYPDGPMERFYYDFLHPRNRGVSFKEALAEFDRNQKNTWSRFNLREDHRYQDAGKLLRDFASLSREDEEMLTKLIQQSSYVYKEAY